MVFGKHINKYYLKYCWLLLLGVAALFLVDHFSMDIPKIYGKIIDGLSGTNTTFSVSDVRELCLDLLKIAGIMIIGRCLWRVGFFMSAILVESDIRNEMFDHCKDLSQSFYQTNKVGNMMSLFTNDLETINECFGDGALMFFDALMLGYMTISRMFKIHALLATLSMIPIVLMGIITGIIGKYMMEKWKIRQEAFSELSDFSQETFSGLAVIKAFVKETKELMAFKKVNKNNENANVNFTKASTLLNIFVTLFVQSVMCVILGFGGYLAFKGKFSAGTLIEFIGYFDSAIWPIMAISRLIEMKSRGKASLQRISELLDTKIDVIDNKDEIKEDILVLKGSIEFKDLTFRYPLADYDALKGVSFKIKAGENIGIVGKTGAGKSTIVDLILRTYNVPDNKVFLDDIDINALSIKVVRTNCAYVPQDNFLFSDSIASNIAFAFEGNAKDVDIKKVAILADLDSNVNEFPEGYNTVLGERGITISGGQKQRTSIARALLKDAPILILDDSVSAVDTNTEKTIIKNLKETRKGKTTILIAHRISTIRHMDKIMFVSDGKVIGFGSHDELYASCKDYKKMVDLQKLEDEYGGDLNA